MGEYGREPNKVDIDVNLLLDACDATAGWTVLGNDTINLETTTNHILGAVGLEFDKANGAANTTIAGIQKTLSSLDASLYTPEDMIIASMYLSALTNVANVFIRLGTNSSNYTQWQVDDSDLVAGWNTVGFPLGIITSTTGTGWNNTDIDYIVIGVTFDAETDTLADIAVDRIAIHTAAPISTVVGNITSSGIAADVNLAQVAGAATLVGGGVEAGSLRITIANDSTGLISVDDNAGSLTIDNVDITAAATSLAIMDDWDNAASDGASVSGDVAHDSLDAGEPAKIGFKAYSFDGTAPQTDVAEADRVNGISDLSGIQYVQTAHPFFWSVSADYAAAQTNTTVKAAPGVSLKLYITDIFLSNGATAGNVTLLDGSGGTVKWECYPAINGGAAWSPKNPIALTANTLLAITSTTVTTHTITINGFTAV